MFMKTFKQQEKTIFLHKNYLIFSAFLLLSVFYIFSNCKQTLLNSSSSWLRKSSKFILFSYSTVLICCLFKLLSNFGVLRSIESETIFSSLVGSFSMFPTDTDCRTFLKLFIFPSSLKQLFLAVILVLPC